MKTKKINRYKNTQETHIDFDSLNESLDKLGYYYDWITKYYKNEIRIHNHNNGKDIRDIDNLNKYKTDLIEKLKNIDQDKKEEIIKLAQLKFETEVISEKINANFLIFCKKSLSAETRYKASNENEELNNKFNELIIDYETRLRNLEPIFNNTDDKIYDVIYTSILKNIDIHTIKDVITQYEKMITGKKTEKECIAHGIQYTENKYDAPKGLLNFMINKK
jgi:hypothetical protein